MDNGESRKRLSESNHKGLSLRIYMARHCLTSPETVRLAEEVRRQFANVHVELIDFDDEGVRNSDDIRTAPTYVLDGKVLYKGNPVDRDLFRSLDEAIAAGQVE